MRVMFLDDMEERHKAFLQTARRTPGLTRVEAVWSAKQAIEMLSTQPQFDAAFLDHDLHPEHYAGEFVAEEARATSGMAVAEYIAKMEYKRPGYVIVHSWNGPASTRMCNVLREAGIRFARIPFDPFWWTIPRIG